MHKVVISAQLINILTIEEVFERLVVVRAACVPLHPGDPLGQHPAHRAHRHQDAAANAVQGDNSGRRKPPVDLVPTAPAAAVPLL